MRKEELIEKYEHLNHDCFRRVDVSEVLGDLKKLDEPKPLKLKDIISRMKQLFPLSRNEWIDEILHEFGDDFGLWKYKAGLEQGKLEGEWVGQQLKDADKIRQELNKPVVPQFVVDWYEENKDDFEGNLFRCAHNIPSTFDGAKLNEFERWFLNASIKAFQILVNMHQFGYEVEKEKRYIVKVKGVEESHKYLNHRISLDSWFFSGESEPLDFSVKHTRKELEEAGFEEVFNSPLFEVKEVEG